MEYNEIGQLVEKDLHGSNAQSIDYRYNIRGWLTSINNSNLNSDSGVTNDDSSDKYGMELNYNTSVTFGSTSSDVLYGGNITSITWKSGTSNKKAYAYNYDEMGQIKEADYKEYVSSSWLDQSGAYDLPLITYDLNGNITALERKNSSGSDLHDLSYTYSTNSNLISSLTDNITSTTYSGYTYDDNGNIKEDKQKGFTYDYYPTLNKISSITKGTDEVTYIYDALGTKLKKYSSATAVYYSGAFVYDNNKDLDYIINSQGTVVNGAGGFEYQYNLSDHLGNVRVVVDDGGTVLQETDYYPFGLAFSLNNLDKNTYLYTGKEYQNFSIGGTSEAFFDFSARVYNPVTARWNSPDPLGEKYYSSSPYMNVSNNPIRFYDPKGMEKQHVNTEDTEQISIPYEYIKFCGEIYLKYYGSDYVSLFLNSGGAASGRGKEANKMRIYAKLNISQGKGGIKIKIAGIPIEANYDIGGNAHEAIFWIDFYSAGFIDFGLSYIYIDNKTGGSAAFGPWHGGTKESKESKYELYYFATEGLKTNVEKDNSFMVNDFGGFKNIKVYGNGVVNINAGIDINVFIIGAGLEMGYELYY